MIVRAGSPFAGLSTNFPASSVARKGIGLVRACVISAVIVSRKLPASTLGKRYLKGPFEVAGVHPTDCSIVSSYCICWVFCKYSLELFGST